MRRIACIAAVTLALAGCFEEAPDLDARFAEGERMMLDQEYLAARDLWKRYLLERPQDAGAHFYLGRCYLNAGEKEAWYMLAQGEYETALNLFLRNGRQLPIARFETPEYFEMICHLEMTKVYSNQIFYLIEYGAPVSALAPLLEKCRESIDAARAINPASPDIGVMENILGVTIEAIRRRNATPPPGTPPQAPGRPDPQPSAA